MSQGEVLVGSVLWEAQVAGCAAQTTVALVVTAKARKVVCYACHRAPGRQRSLENQCSMVTATTRIQVGQQ